MLVDLFWGTMLLLIIVIAGGLLMATLAQPYIGDDDLDLDTRTFLYDACALQHEKVMKSFLVYDVYIIVYIDYCIMIIILSCFGVVSEFFSPFFK